MDFSIILNIYSSLILFFINNLITKCIYIASYTILKFRYYKEIWKNWKILKNYYI